MDRKERLRSDLENNQFLEDKYEYEQIERNPSRLRVIGRKVMDVMKIRSERSERMRDREAMAVVLREYREEKEARRQEVERRREEQRLADEKREQERVERDVELERRKLESDMSKARSYFERHAEEKVVGERVQEGLERELNGRLTTIEDLDEAVEAEEEGVSRRSVEFDGGDVTVYDLSGKPFEMISHAIDYRYANWSMGNADIGNKTAQDLLQHPEQWERTRDEVEKEEGYGTRREDALGDVISASYVNSETNIDTRVSKFGGYYTLCYGFEQLKPDSVLHMANGDAGSNNTGGKREALLSRSDADAIERLEGMGGAPNYNEVVLRRYDENGEPLKPSYIIAEDGHITEEALRHAKYFGIPVVNIERKNYDARLEQRARTAIEGISEDSSYDEISDAIVTLKRAPRYYHKFQVIDAVGRMRDGEAHKREREFAAQGSMEEKICELEEIEFEKRIDLIEDALKAGVAQGGSKPKGFEYFSVIEEKSNGMPSSCDSLIIQFRREGDPRFVRTTIYDGENVSLGEEAVEKGYMTQEQLEGGDSSYYKRLAPLAEEYRKH